MYRLGACFPTHFALSGVIPFPRPTWRLHPAAPLGLQYATSVVLRKVPVPSSWTHLSLLANPSWWPDRPSHSHMVGVDLDGLSLILLLSHARSYPFLLDRPKVLLCRLYTFI